MPKTIGILQANVGRRRQAQLSILNDSSTQDFELIMITEPNIMDIDGKPVVHQHAHWTIVKPTLIRDDSVIHSFRSLIYLNRKTRFRQVSIPSPDIAAGLLTTATQHILVISVYVPRDPSASREQNGRELTQRLHLIALAWGEAKEKWGADVQLFVAGDFNRHDQLWGGDAVASSQYHGEGTPILEWMGDLGMNSMLPRGTKTFKVGLYETTIDLALTSDGLFQKMLKCQIHDTEHGSDHRAIASTFNDWRIENSDYPKLNFRRTDWEAVRKDLQEQLGPIIAIHSIDELEHQTETIIRCVKEAAARHTPETRPSPYMKAWWDDELSMLRREYTTLRNRNTNSNRNGHHQPHLEAQVEAAKRKFHEAIRDKKRHHWQAFLDDSNNIWRAARYLKSEESAFGNVPLLIADGKEVEEDKDKAKTLLRTFFPPTPAGWTTTTQEQQVPPILDNPELTIGEIEEAVLRVKPWKAPGVDGLPNVVWKETWPVLKEWIHAIFQASIKLGTMPSAWKTARILPLRKPNKPDYTIPKAYRPISLLSTLGKILELVIARRLSYWAETHDLLPTNQFGARPRRSCEQALILLTEKIKEAWRQGKVLSLVSFDVKGAYNGVPREVMTDRLARKGIPANVVQWVNSFCSNRRATVVVNGTETEAMDIAFPGLPQGSPLSPILYIFFNADLVREVNDNRRGAMGFVDDYTRWTVSESVEENMDTLQNEVVPRALKWATDSGATFEGDKTTLIHFTHFRNTKKIAQPLQALRVGESVVAPAQSAKILGVIFDRELRFKEHVARAAKRGWQGVQALSRLRGIRPATARQLYNATVASKIDYAAAVWFSPYLGKAMPIWIRGLLTPIQRVAAKAITNCFRTVAEEAACAEAHMLPTQARLARKITKFWVDCHTLPKTNLMWGCMEKVATAEPDSLHKSPLMFMRTHTMRLLDDMETIDAFAVAPWQQSLRQVVHISPEREEALKRCQNAEGTEIQIFTDASMKNDKVGYSILAWVDSSAKTEMLRTIGTSDMVNVYIAELGAIMEAVEWADRMLAASPGTWGITVYSDSMSALQAIANPRYQSGQALIRRAVRILWDAQAKGKRLQLAWVPGHAGIPGNETADALAATTTTSTSAVMTPPWLKSKFKSVVLGSLNRVMQTTRSSSEWTTGRRLKEVDSALPGKHVRLLYDTLTRTEAQALAQLRTGHSKLRGFLARIRAEETDQCECGQGKEDTRHFLFHCQRYQHLRGDMIKEGGERYGNLSYMLGGRSSYQNPDGSSRDGPIERWKPNLTVVRAVIKFALKTGRLGSQSQSATLMQNSQRFGI
jgi:ribonuclease HI